MSPDMRNAAPGRSFARALRSHAEDPLPGLAPKLDVLPDEIPEEGFQRHRNRAQHGQSAPNRTRLIRSCSSAVRIRGSQSVSTSMRRSAR